MTACFVDIADDDLRAVVRQPVRGRAVARPMPDAPPVTTARFPENRILMSFFWDRSMGLEVVNRGLLEKPVCRPGATILPAVILLAERSCPSTPKPSTR
ncbi:hypothetical protein [uncultured Sphingomonas sp.]|uniref:hypothetical protein n=1 Tax=uncultured Sphingomonas sp. TaxID=158754 RepID=UPI0035C9DD34